MGVGLAPKGATHRLKNTKDCPPRPTTGYGRGFSGLLEEMRRKIDANPSSNAVELQQVSRLLRCERFARATRDFGPLRAVLGHTTRVLTYHAEWLRF